MSNWRSTLFPLLGLLIAALIGCHRQAAPAAAGDTLTVALSTNTIRVGDLIHLRLTSVHGTNLHLNPPELGKGKEILVRTRHAATEKLKDGRVRDVLDLSLIHI